MKHRIPQCAGITSERLATWPSTHHSMLLLMRQRTAELAMRTTITIDDDLLREASMAAGSDKPADVVRQALQAFVQREAARRLSRLGGSDPHATAGARRRTPSPARHAEANG